jgi:hypothetical protein
VEIHSTEKTLSALYDISKYLIDRIDKDYGNDDSNDQSSGITANANIEISSTNSNVDSAGYYHIVGEVENSGPISIRSVKVIATLYDSSNAVVGTDYGYADPSDIGSKIKHPLKY